MELKVWVISPDAKAAREYVALPLSLEPGQNPPVGLAFDPGRVVTERLVRAGG